MKAYPSFGILGRFELFDYPTTAHSNILELMLSSLKLARIVLRSDVMLGAQAFNMASKMADVLIVLVRSFLLLQSG